MIVMRAISLWQPWASLWLTNLKIHETRAWSTKHRGWLIVQAAKHRDSDCNDFAREMGMDPDQLPYGAILGAVDLVSCMWMVDTSPAHHEDGICGNWAPGRFAWRKGRCVTLPSPIPYRGRQTLFDVPADAIAPLLDIIPGES